MLYDQMKRKEGKDASLHAQDEARHRPLNDYPGDKLIKKADHAATGKQFGQLDDQTGQAKQGKDDGGVIAVTTSIRNRSYRGFEGNGNDNEESAPDMQGQANQNNKSGGPSSMISPNIFLDAMRGQGAATQQDAKYNNREYDFGQNGQRNEANENPPDMSPSQLLKPNINIKIQKIQEALEQDKARGNVGK